MKYIKSFIFLFIFSMANAQGGKRTSLSLEDAISYALQNNTTLKNAILEIEYAENRVDETKAQGLPQINGSTNFTHSYEVPTSLIPGDFAGQPGTNIPVQFGVPFTMTAGIGTQQLLFDGTFFLGLKAASEFVNISKLSSSSTEIEVKEAVIKSYYMALISDLNLNQLNESLKSIKALYEETLKLYEAGLAEQLDVDRLVFSVSNIEVSINQLKNQSKIAKQLLLKSMGQDVNLQVNLISPLPSPESPDISTSFDPENRIEMQLINQQIKLNELNLRRYKVGYMPSLYGNFNYGGNTFASDGEFNTLGNDWFGNGSYGFTLNVPIFDGFYKKSKINQVKIDIAKTENSKKELELAIALQVNQAKIKYNNAITSLELQKKSKNLAEKIFTTTEIKFKEGVGSSIEMINAESALTSARTNYLNALYELNVAKIDLQKALGAL